MLVSFDKTDRVSLSIHDFSEKEMRLLEDRFDVLRSPDKMDWLTIKLINQIELTFFRNIMEAEND
jgi:hypothetical protein